MTTAAGSALATSATDLEVALGDVMGGALGVRSLDGEALSPRRALEDVVRAALLRPPCVVSFSGGIDSSAVLALAAYVARREGLALPVPVTNVVVGDAAADESRWQELVVRHLELPEWERLRWSTELGVAGPHARRVLERHGELTPFNVHFHAPVVERARGGSMLTGVGGDQLFGTVQRRWALPWLQRRRPLEWRVVPGVALAASPRPIRWGAGAVRLARGELSRMRWLTAEARARVAARYEGWASREPLAWDRSTREWLWPSRQVQVNLAGKVVLGRAADVQVINPFWQPDVLVAMATRFGVEGPGTRSRVVRELLGDVLPAQLFERDDKSSFNGAFWTPETAAAARSWNGEGIDRRLVDADALRLEWRKDDPDPHTFLLLKRLLRAGQLRAL